MKITEIMVDYLAVLFVAYVGCWHTCTFWDVIVLSCLVDLKKIIQCVISIDLHMTYDADVSRRTSVGTCKYELAE